jgi:hypothetical protein
VEDGRYVDENELLPSLELGEEKGCPTRLARDDALSSHHHPRPFADKLGQHESDRIPRPLSAESAAYSVPKPVNQDGSGWNDIVVAELEKEVDLVCEDRDRLSVASLSCSPRSPRRSIELSLHLNNRQSQRDIAHGRSEERRDAPRSSTYTLDVGKEKPMQQDAEGVTEERQQ